MVYSPLMTSGLETDRTYSNKKPQLPETAWGRELKAEDHSSNANPIN